METIKLSKEQASLFEDFSRKVTTESGESYYYMPYWFKKEGDNTFIKLGWDSLPQELTEQINKKRQ